MSYLYELINPSDITTFRAENNKVACYCTVVLGSGKYGCEKYTENEEPEHIPGLLLLDPDPTGTIKKYLECSIEDFAEKNKEFIKKCFASFAYCSFGKRLIYDDALSAITDIDKLKTFKAKHEDRKRTSMNEIVNTAWRLAEI